MINTQYIISNLGVNPEFYDEVISLIESEFHYSSNNHYSVDFAPLMNPNNFENCLIVIDTKKNTVVAHLAFNKREMIKDNIKLPTVFIGGIVTHPKHRGNGLFKKLLNKAFEVNNSAAIFLLWSDLKGVYEKFNFHLAGGTIQTGMKTLTTSNIPMNYIKTQFPLLTVKEFEEICKLYRNEIGKKFFTVNRLESDWSIIKEMKSVDLYIKKNSDNEIIEYFCLGKGSDLEGIIHEFVSANQNNIIENLKEFKLWLPEYLNLNTPEQSHQYTAYFKIGNIDVLNNFFKEIKLDLLIESITFSIIHFKSNDVIYSASPNDFLHYIWGPSPLLEFESFKLSPYISGLDSV